MSCAVAMLLFGSTSFRFWLELDALYAVSYAVRASSIAVVFALNADAAEFAAPSAAVRLSCAVAMLDAAVLNSPIAVSRLLLAVV